MSVTLLTPCYFGPLDFFAALFQAPSVCWEYCDNYQKQTYRNRQYIYGANGRLSLNIPVVHERINGNRPPYRAVQIDSSEKWQTIHWKSIQNAYQSSPFFEYYQDELEFLYQRSYSNLYDFNIACITSVLNCLDSSPIFEKTEKYYPTYSENSKIIDYRYLSYAKRESPLRFPAYFQVFQEKHGFIPNLSILDLLFNYGPETPAYLRDLEFT